MSFSTLKSAQVIFPRTSIIDIEADLSSGLSSFIVVGLPDKAVEESRERIGSAIKNTGFKFPKKGKNKITISLAPADIRKEGPHFDLPIALAYLLASEDVSFDAGEKIFAGELALSGLVRPIKGTLPLVIEAKKKGIKEVFVPRENVEEATLVEDIIVYGVSTLREIIEHLEGRQLLTPAIKKEATENIGESYSNTLDEIIGQETAKRGLLIALAGGHNICFWGPPGTGKTMLARAGANLLPQLSNEEMIDVTTIHSVAGTLTDSHIKNPPVRSPHHTSSYVAVIGGGTIPKPGEATLAHRGILFLDEFPEFDRKVIDALREPLEEGIVRISRARGSAVFPARFILIATMNPCSCGFYGSKVRECTCTPGKRESYRRKISGPITDRIDIWVPVEHIEHERLLGETEIKKSDAEYRQKILEARKKQRSRLEKYDIIFNADMKARHLKQIKIKDSAKNILDQSAGKLLLSPRAYHKTIKVAQTIADLEGRDEIGEQEILEALQFRYKEMY